MGDVGNYWREAKAEQQRMKDVRARLGKVCEHCEAKRLNRETSEESPILLPGQKCHRCGNRDPRKRNRRRKGP